MDWEASNCDRCKKAATKEQHVTLEHLPCEIEDALITGTLTGEVTEDIARRMGYFDNNPPKAKGFAYVWQCGEVDWTEEWKDKARAKLGLK